MCARKYALSFVNYNLGVIKRNTHLSSAKVVRGSSWQKKRKEKKTWLWHGDMVYKTKTQYPDVFVKR